MFRLLTIPATVARGVIVKHHYSHAWPTGNFLSMGVFLDSTLIGVVTFGHPANKNNAASVGLKGRELAELTRLWIADHAPKFVESRAIATCLRILRRDSICRAVISYADPMHGHVGTVYQASNWLYLGQMQSSSMLKFSSGLMHKRAAFDRFGTDRPSRLRTVDPLVCYVEVPGKHKYIYAVDPQLLPALRQLAKPYPKKPSCAGPQGATGDQPAEGGAGPTPALHDG